MCDEIEGKILSMYGLGMSFSDIAGHVEEIYGIRECPRRQSAPLQTSSLTNKLTDEVRVWQAQPRESVYPFVPSDGIHYKIGDKGRYETKAAYTVLTLNMDCPPASVRTSGWQCSRT